MFLYVFKQTLHKTWIRISRKVNSIINMQKHAAYYFYIKTKKISIDFHICISLPLNTHARTACWYAQILSVPIQQHLMNFGILEATKQVSMLDASFVICCILF